ncbi:DNA modification methylase [Brevundimonas sp.]|uniref:DNA modification methylase n=1 Tax=Brevundimonas sp. TaxID=1871086 RepID=UPI002D1F9C02|nr:DNA modification methylase [Brevundimonas sp.]
MFTRPITAPQRLPVTPRPVAGLKVPKRQVRDHPPKQIELIRKSILRVGFTVPLVIGTDDQVLAGAARLEAARALGMVEVPTVSLAHLPEADQRAYLLADNKLAEMASWDDDILKLELAELSSLDLSFSLQDLGFETAELDLLLASPETDDGAAQDAVPELAEVAVTRLGDIWRLGPHRLVCGDARDPAVHTAVMQGEAARMVFTDPPYNVRIVGHVMKRDSGRREFPMASGEMTPAQFTEFLSQTLGAAAGVSMDGSIHYVFMDWRHMAEMLAAGQSAIGELKNVCVWAKPNAGMGAFYRSQHELAFVFKKGRVPHVNNFGLGEHRYRTNVWKYDGASGFHGERDADLALHPTAKPVAMVADAIQDVSHRDDIVLDPFGGSGSTLMAADRTGRRARLIELDPLYCDVICRRFIAAGGTAVLEGSEAFDVVAAERLTAIGEAA